MRAVRSFTAGISCRLADGRSRHAIDRDTPRPDGATNDAVFVVRLPKFVVFRWEDETTAEQSAHGGMCVNQGSSAALVARCCGPERAPAA